MILAQATTETAVIEALKQTPGIIAALIVTALFLRYLSDLRKEEREERAAFRASLEKQSEAVNKLAVVVESLKEAVKHDRK